MDVEVRSSSLTRVGSSYEFEFRGCVELVGRLHT